jgi:hypothetical protein
MEASAIIKQAQTAKLQALLSLEPRGNVLHRENRARVNALLVDLANLYVGQDEPSELRAWRMQREARVIGEALVERRQAAINADRATRNLPPLAYEIH